MILIPVTLSKRLCINASICFALGLCYSHMQAKIDTEYYTYNYISIQTSISQTEKNRPISAYEADSKHNFKRLKT